MPDHIAAGYRPTSLERVAVLEQLVHVALEDFQTTEHQVLWDALIDARAALASGRTVASALALEDPVVTLPAAVCTSCGHGLAEGAHHWTGECASRSSNEEGAE